MSLIYVTGSPTAGKTAISEKLISFGLDAVDTDDPNHTGISGWHNLETGEYVAGFNQLVLTPETAASHIWRFSDGVLEKFKEESNQKDIYLCGFFRDYEVVCGLGDLVIWLSVDEETIRQRFKLPREVTWGQEEWQVLRTLERNNQLESEFKKLGATIIDATRPLDVVVDDILRLGVNLA